MYHQKAMMQQSSIDSLTTKLEEVAEHAKEANLSMEQMVSLVGVLGVTERELVNALRRLGVRKQEARQRIWQRILRTCSYVKEGDVLPKHLYYLQYFLWPIQMFKAAIVRAIDRSDAQFWCDTIKKKAWIEVDGQIHKIPVFLFALINKLYEWSIYPVKPYEIANHILPFDILR
jgi:hypothetical protein